MKKIGFIVIFVVCFTNIQAQKKLSFLQGEKEMSFVIDYSEAKIDKKPSEVFFTLKNMDEQDFEEKYKKSMILKFASTVNDYLSSLVIMPNLQNVNYQLTIKVINVDKNGEIDANIIITKIGYSEILMQFSANGDGGWIGSFTNLSGDGIKNLAEKVGKYIEKNMRK